MIELYVIRNLEGKFYRSKGFSGYGHSWVEDVSRARVYGNLGPARAQVSFWYKHFPQFGIPEILKLKIDGFEVLDEKSRVEAEAIKRKKLKEESELRQKQAQLEAAEREYKRAQETLNKLRGQQ